MGVNNEDHFIPGDLDVDERIPVQLEVTFKKENDEEQNLKDQEG